MLTGVLVIIMLIRLRSSVGSPLGQLLFAIVLLLSSIFYMRTLRDEIVFAQRIRG